MNSKQHDYLFKVAIIGNSCVGKSSILKRYADDTFNDSYLATIGVDFRFKTLIVDGKSVKLQIWDTAGQERFRTITSTYYKGAECILLVFDIHIKKSFQDIQNFWLGEIEKYGEKQVEICLLGNKSDYQQGREVTLKEAQDYADSKNLPFYEVSAKNGDQISQAFLNCVKKCIKKTPPRQMETKGLIAQISKKKQLLSVKGGSQAKKKCEC